MTLEYENYETQNTRWPQSGRHVLAQYDDDNPVVYQAYRPSIAKYAVEHQAFGGDFSFRRMSWIKPNFLWMMYRSGWATKPGQEHILAIRMTREGFDQICKTAVKSSFDRAGFSSEAQWKAAVQASDVRLQWDPDHLPNGGPTERRAVQLGLRGQALRLFSDQWIREIEDVTAFVHEQYAVLQKQGTAALITPSERVYPAHENLKADRMPSEHRGLRFVTGDATSPFGKGPRVIAHVCNDVGGWGRGFVVALSKKWAEPEAAYRKWAAEGGEAFALGTSRMVRVEEGLWVANMIGQRDHQTVNGVPPVRYEAIRKCLQQVREHCVTHNASVHMPRIGCGLAGGRWQEIQQIVEEELLRHGIDVVVYDLPEKHNPIPWKA
jgi:O-acetyl-ADP-ribose deacetylase (regulator of RNase III)